jgi:uncharacterized repeat protein (TIGR04138 family)
MTHPLKRLLKEDPRYPVEAYEFVRDALAYAHEVMQMGAAADGGTPVDEADRHLTGQELCEASRRYAIDQYGMMARVVLNSWGIHSTSDVGELVYNLINVDLMRKSPTDRREDFNDVFDFRKAFQDDFDFAASLESERELPEDE